MVAVSKLTKADYNYLGITGTIKNNRIQLKNLLGSLNKKSRDFKNNPRITQNIGEI